MTDTRSASSVAYEALNLARSTQSDQEKHEDICAIRYQNINDSIADIKGWMKWAGGGAFTLIMSVLAFLAVAQFNANDAARQEQQAKIEALQRQLSQNP